MKSKRARVRLSLGERSYSAIIGAGLLADIGKLAAALCPSRHAVIVSDRKLTRARARLKSSLRKAGWTFSEIPVEAGEALKDFKRLYPLYGRFLDSGVRRDSVLFALGGGSIGDAAGFLASTYLRGIPWIGVPTTLLAQVDSSMGGKTALNHEGGKNLIGTFHQPAAVFCDVDLLGTLSSRELISGLGEALKYGLVFDPSFFAYLRKNWDRALKHDRAVLIALVRKSLHWKARSVEEDELDCKGVREFLNFGHTLGHALEKATGYRKYQHGEAVLWGMRFALALSSRMGALPERERRSIDSFLGSLDVPPWPKSVSLKKLLAPLSKDKKFRQGALHFVLLRGIGKPFSYHKIAERDIVRALELLLRESA